jgi:hypothetical protein
MSGISAECAAILGAVIGVAGAIIGAVIGAWASVYAARQGSNLQFRNFEMAKFRAEFVADILALRSADTDACQILNEETMRRHKRAVVIFESLLSSKNKSELWASWNEHERATKTKAPGSLDNRKDECNAALVRIQKVLAFAELPSK